MIIKQGQLFRYFTDNTKYVCQYCGKVNNKYLIWNETFKSFKLVKQNWFKEHKEKIQLMIPKENYLKGRSEPIATIEEKERFRKNLAKRRKERYLKECQVKH